MSDTPHLMRYGGFVALIAVFAITLGDSIPGAPALTGWSDLQTQLGTDPLDPGRTNPFPTLTMPDAPDTGCDWWDFGCYAGAVFDAVLYIGGLIFAALVFVAEFLFWLVYEVFLILAALFGTASLTFSGIPAWLQGILWILAIPLLVLVVWSVLRLIRGDEG